MHIAFLVTSPYQVYHYKWIAQHFNEVTVLVELREHDFMVSEEFLLEHFPGRLVEWVPNNCLHMLDGRFDAIVCQTPILPLHFLERTYVIAQQYSLAKEAYQYGLWRSQANLNLMYGPYSVDKVSPFAHAIAAGNPLLDPLFVDDDQKTNSSGPRGSKPTILYMPTYGKLSTLPTVLPEIEKLDYNYILKLHHAEDRNAASNLPANCTLAYSDENPVALLQRADYVLADFFSGSAYDALYAHKPVILVKTEMGFFNSKDGARVADTEGNNPLVEDVAAVWNPKNSFAGTVNEARLKSKDEAAYRRFITTYFVNPGNAGKACADQIIELINNGEPYRFSRLQVRNAMRSYVLENRALRKQKKSANHTLPRKGKEFMARLREKAFKIKWLKIIYKTLKLELIRFYNSRLTRSVIRVLSHKVSYINRPIINNSKALPEKSPQYGYLPWKRRQNILALLQSYLENSKLHFAVHHFSETGFICAVLNNEKRTLFKILKKIGQKDADLEVYIGKGKKTITAKCKAHSMDYVDLYAAEWIKVGVPVSWDKTQVGFIDVIFVSPDQTRVLALSYYASKVDWTEEFMGVEEAKQSPKITVQNKLNEADRIDVVYTWVDSYDPQWKRLRYSYSKDAKTEMESSLNIERYLDREELKYSLRSLWMYAPFIGHIYIVTADQVPSWLNTGSDKISLISHRDIFPDPEMLPTFNSHAIESCLHRIKGLSEHFIYFNDDIFLNSEVTEDDFFTRGGLMKVKLSPTQFIMEGRPGQQDIPTHWAAYNAVHIINRDFGISFDRKQKHVPFPLKKSLLQEIENKYAQELWQTRVSRFRSPYDLALPSMFAPFYSIATHRGVEWPNFPKEYIYADTGRADFYKILKNINKNKPKYFCLNSTKHREIPLSKQARIMQEFLEERYPLASPFEK